MDSSVWSCNAHLYLTERGEDHSFPFSIFSKHFHSAISLPFERQKWTRFPFRMLWCGCNFWAAVRWWHGFQGSLERSGLAGLWFPDLLEGPGTLCDAWEAHLPLLRALRQAGGQWSEHHWKAWDLQCLSVAVWEEVRVFLSWWHNVSVFLKKKNSFGVYCDIWLGIE